jgi:hypothetical protein
MSKAAAQALHPDLYGLLAEFHEPQRLLEATRRAREAGFRRMDAYTPFPVEGLDEALHFTPRKLPYVVLAGGIVGGLTGFFMQYYATVIDWPINVGGRPYNSWPAYMVITFEMTILFAALAAVLGMLALNGLPRPHHPLFNVDRFELASRNHFFLCIESRDPNFDLEKTTRFLESVGADRVEEVPM